MEERIALEEFITENELIEQFSIKYSTLSRARVNGRLKVSHFGS